MWGTERGEGCGWSGSGIGHWKEVTECQPVTSIRIYWWINTRCWTDTGGTSCIFSMEERDITDKGETWSMKTDLNIYESLIIGQYLRWEPVYPVKKRILEIQSNPGSRDRVTGGWDTCQGGIGAIQLFRRHSKPQKLNRERYDRSLTIFPWLCFPRPNNSRVYSVGSSLWPDDSNGKLVHTKGVLVSCCQTISWTTVGQSGSYMVQL